MATTTMTVMVAMMMMMMTIRLVPMAAATDETEETVDTMDTVATVATMRGVVVRVSVVVSTSAGSVRMTASERVWLRSRVGSVCRP